MVKSKKKKKEKIQTNFTFNWTFIDVFYNIITNKVGSLCCLFFCRTQHETKFKPYREKTNKITTQVSQRVTAPPAGHSVLFRLFTVLKTVSTSGQEKKLNKLRFNSTVCICQR